jgi:CBS domain-containing protein
MPVRELVQVFARARISGAPVVGAAGEILGVVSATDVVALAAYAAFAHGRSPCVDEEGAGDEESDDYFRNDARVLDFEIVAAEGCADYVVEDIMTPAAFSVKSHDSIQDLACFLLRERIHRALVIDNGVLVGIATTFDVLQAVAEQTEELNLPRLVVAGADRG